jgi:hypothetical protein
VDKKNLRQGQVKMFFGCVVLIRADPAPIDSCQAPLACSEHGQVLMRENPKNFGFIAP